MAHRHVGAERAASTQRARPGSISGLSARSKRTVNRFLHRLRLVNISNVLYALKELIVQGGSKMRAGAGHLVRMHWSTATANRRGQGC